ncbi:MAG: Qat anti-phage system associated protein QatB [Thermodesulfobacteriota bacterium]|nr:Qat anti-phage system associated protein QatB [Thermodesulfobacteriota bacterium]
MGTSSSHGGPKGKNPLLPDDFIDAPENAPDDDNVQSNPKPQNNPETELWGNAKRQVSQLINNSDRKIGPALSSYVKAYGGGKGASSTAISGKATTIKLGNFLSSISSQGIQNTLSQYNIDYIGRPFQEVLSDLVNKLSPSPNTKEDAVARNALLDTVEIIYNEIDANDGSIEILDNLDDKKFNNIINTYISAYIFQRFLNDLESRFEMYASNEGSALQMEKQIKDYISGAVDNKLIKNDFSTIDFSSNLVKRIIDEIYNDCYSVIEEALS